MKTAYQGWQMSTGRREGGEEGYSLEIAWKGYQDRWRSRTGGFCDGNVKPASPLNQENREEKRRGQIHYKII